MWGLFGFRYLLAFIHLRTLLQHYGTFFFFLIVFFIYFIIFIVGKVRSLGLISSR